jgi:acetolactate synthase small subunit
MTVSVEAPSADQLAKELERLVDVLSVRDLTGHPELATSLAAARTQADGGGDEGEAA